MTINMNIHDLTRGKRRELIKMVEKKAKEQNISIDITEIDMEMDITDIEFDLGNNVVKLKV